MHTETGWLVERKIAGSPIWWAGTRDCREWTTDAYRAVRFSRKQDAEQMARYYGLNLGVDGWATEHAFDVEPGTV